MANSVLTPTAVTREILRVLHQKLNFVSKVNRTYDDSFAQKGAKIGDSLKIRLPNKYTVRTGKTLTAQDTAETSTTLTVATQKGVDMNFSTAELTMSLQDFSKRIIEPAAAALVASVEADALQTMTKDIYNFVGTPGTTPASLLVWGQARQKLNESLTPKDNNRFVVCDSATSAAMVEALKGVFQDSSSVKEQYLEGMLGRVGGFDWYENDSILNLTAGSNTRSNGPVLSATIANGATSCTIATGGNNTTIKTGDVFTIAGIYAVNHETKQSYSSLQQFVVTADVTLNGSGAGTVAFQPTFYSSGANQNVSAAPAGTEALVFAGTASTAYGQNLAFHQDAFAFATADLEDVSQYGAWGARENYDGLSIRLARQYDINNDNVPCRLDILYGYKTIRPQLACRVTK